MLILPYDEIEQIFDNSVHLIFHGGYCFFEHVFAIRELSRKHQGPTFSSSLTNFSSHAF